MPLLFRNIARAIGSPEDAAATDSTSAWSWISLLKGIYAQIAAGGIGGGAPTNAAYVMVSANATTTAERVLTAGTAIGLTDGGANGNITVALTDAELLALAGLTSAADKAPYFTGSGTAALADLTAFARTLLDDANAGDARATLGLVIGTNVQAFDADLAALAGLTSAADKVPYFTGSGTAAVADFTAFGRTLAALADASAGRTALGVVIGTDVQAFHARLADIAGITYAQGDIFYYNGSNIVKLAAGTNGHFLKTQGAGANPIWAAIAGGGDLLSTNNLSDVANAATARTNLGVGTGDSPQFTAVNIGHASDTTVTRTGAGDIAVEGNALYRAGGTDVPVADGGTGASTAADARTNLGVAYGKHTIWIPASSCKSRATSGAATGLYDSGSSDVTISTFDFDTTTGEFIHTLPIGMPKSWNESTVTAIVYWTNTGGASTETVRWTVAGLAISDDDTLNGTFGTAVNIDDTWLAQNDLHITAESGAITIGGTPAENDLVIFQIGRDTANDNMAGDALFIGIKILVTNNANNDD